MMESRNKEAARTQLILWLVLVVWDWMILIRTKLCGGKWKKSHPYLVIRITCVYMLTMNTHFHSFRFSPFFTFPHFFFTAMHPLLSIYCALSILINLYMLCCIFIVLRMPTWKIRRRILSLTYSYSQVPFFLLTFSLFAFPLQFLAFLLFNKITLIVYSYETCICVWMCLTVFLENHGIQEAMKQLKRILICVLMDGRSN